MFTSSCRAQIIVRCLLSTEQNNPHETLSWAGTAQSVQRLATDWTARRSNPGCDEIFRFRPDWLWDPPSLLHNGYRVYPGGKAAGAWRWPPTPHSGEVKERVDLYIYSISGYLWHVIGEPVICHNTVNRFWHCPKYVAIVNDVKQRVVCGSGCR